MTEKIPIAQLSEKFRGPIFQPGDDGYHEARMIYNAMIDKDPRIITHCTEEGRDRIRATCVENYTRLKKSSTPMTRVIFFISMRTLNRNRVDGYPDRN
jgi:hypothetical protein